MDKEYGIQKNWHHPVIEQLSIILAFLLSRLLMINDNFILSQNELKKSKPMRFVN